MGWDKEAIEKFKAHLCCGTCKHLDYKGDIEDIKSGLLRYCPKRKEYEWLNQDWGPNDICHWYKDVDNFDERYNRLTRIG